MSAWQTAEEEYSARIPADVDRPDRLLGNLTARQLAILTPVALLVAGLVASVRRLASDLPLPLALAVGLPLALVGVVLAVGSLDGLSMDRLVWAGLRYARAPRRLVPAADPAAEVPPLRLAVGGRPSGRVEPPPAALRLPLQGLTAEGVLELGASGAALICRVTPVNFGLATLEEQAQLVAGLARWLHGAVTSGSVQIVLRATRVDLGAVVAQLEEAAGGLPHPDLEAMAWEHAAFLRWVAEGREVLARELLVVFRDPNPRAHEALRHRAEQAASLLAALGVQLAVLDDLAAARVLRASMNPDLPPVPHGVPAQSERLPARQGAVVETAVTTYAGPPPGGRAAGGEGR